MEAAHSVSLQSVSLVVYVAIFGAAALALTLCLPLLFCSFFSIYTPFLRTFGEVVFCSSYFSSTVLKLAPFVADDDDTSSFASSLSITLTCLLGFAMTLGSSSEYDSVVLGDLGRNWHGEYSL